MFKSNIRAINKDIKILLRDAQDLFSEAASLSGEKAEEARARGVELMEEALKSAQNVQDTALASGKEMATSANVYVKENPWSSIGVAASVGLLVGLLVCRK
ncbi:DUF883 family protein [Undibacterium pigrum]|uniref:ElaB/YqjD/DUF883 family membrane-anchored ribosome-binding protein n=1 Tax=Undibacterium pigrum TaxID=401470 RepID=A0A318IV00_9BURK|nr:DUF883 family protein [Undibacterium pigrum]PXX37767.1 ElaB/YqjD/DUF883 family membrane-anchored ribosome-binding protein [Undibacterium pigrum]